MIFTDEFKQTFDAYTYEISEVKCKKEPDYISESFTIKPYEDMSLAVLWDGRRFTIYYYIDSDSWNPTPYFPKEFTDLSEVARVLTFMLKELF